MKKYLVVNDYGSYFNQHDCGSFENREEAITFASLCKKSEPEMKFGVYCLDARVEIK